MIFKNQKFLLLFEKKHLKSFNLITFHFAKRKVLPTFAAEVSMLQENVSQKIIDVDHKHLW